MGVRRFSIQLGLLIAGLSHVMAAQETTPSAGDKAPLMGLPLVIAYSAAKSAYLDMEHSLAAEVSDRGVLVNAVGLRSISLLNP
jgi:NAD(P)-dependent dehydrogenase (short-subunit alcohol dehydrogenase family)